ncbi:hypothetical protein GOA59_32010 [Sinorhizobium meliloti]|uniref:hypothetical protein n=1 Tax=Rhizobium meliloti TaxID=382 RepID=UPI00299DD3A4|nr:hypothetical protein [Sinorhizobium meliloti]MDW9677288.1 hypothetical protein [Sinorhizobium meliloti]MDW9956155.1 hypothetical protein [Sinorhizobium meliloti]MDX0390938.1 hypothetical protein [Sinorhizobium meliloti]
MISSNLWHTENHPKLLQELGRVTIRWAEVDLVLVDLAFVILNGNLEAARQHVFQTAGAGTERLRRFDRIVGSSELSADERRAIMAVTERLRSLYSTRNDIVHSPIVMAYSVEGRRISSRLTKISREGKQRDVSLTTIRKHAEDVGRCIGKMEELATELVEKYLQDHDSDG